MDEPEPMQVPQRTLSKQKTTHAANYQSCSSSEDENMGVSQGNSGPSNTAPQPPKATWYPTGLKFLCPINNHKHKNMACTLFFAICPKD